VLKRLLRPAYHRLRRSALMQRVLRRIALSQDDAWWPAWCEAQFVAGQAGAAYGVTAAERQALADAFKRIVAAIPSGTSPLAHLALAEAALAIPPSTPGVLVECGVWKGASSAALSLVCRRMGRRLVVCDSFEGLPDDGGQRHTGMHTGVYGHYEAGMFAGALDEVQANIAAHGAPEVCDYVRGYFVDSLPTGLPEHIAFAFLDVDLASSTQDCLRAIWPRLAEGGAIFSDDAGDLDVVRVFFDTPWWQAALSCDAPGFVGSGCGLPLRPGHSALGYTRKITQFNPDAWRRVPFLAYPDEA
jgi:O-methyltransferase